MVTINNMDFFELARQAMDVSSPSVEAEVCMSLKCSHCGGKMIENFETDMVCSECGIVDTSNGRIDQGAEWSSCVTDEGAKDGSRVGKSTISRVGLRFKNREDKGYDDRAEADGQD